MAAWRCHALSASSACFWALLAEFSLRLVPVKLVKSDPDIILSLQQKMVCSFSSFSKIHSTCHHSHSQTLPPPPCTLKEPHSAPPTLSSHLMCCCWRTCSQSRWHTQYYLNKEHKCIIQKSYSFRPCQSIFWWLCGVPCVSSKSGDGSSFSFYYQLSWLHPSYFIPIPVKIALLKLWSYLFYAYLCLLELSCEPELVFESEPSILVEEIHYYHYKILVKEQEGNIFSSNIKNAEWITKY